MKIEITNKQFQNLYRMYKHPSDIEKNVSESHGPEYQLASEFFKTLLFASSSKERKDVLESIKKNIQIIDGE